MTEAQPKAAEYVSADGEVLDFDPRDKLTSYQKACSELAAFKFRLIETVAADPLLRTAPCTSVIVAMCSFLTIDKRTLQPTTVYASPITLMAKACIRSDATAKKARKLLAEHGYLVPTGETKEGCTRYRVANPHVERVLCHVAEATEYYREMDKERKKHERRRKRGQSEGGGVENAPPNLERGINGYPDGGVLNTLNYHGEYLGDYSSEGEGYSPDPSENTSASVKDGAGDLIPAPDTQAEAEFMVGQWLGKKPSPMRQRVRDTILGALVAGRLTEANLERLLALVDREEVKGDERAA